MCIRDRFRTNLGIEIAVNPMTTQAQSDARDNRDYALDFTGWGPDYNDQMCIRDRGVPYVSLPGSVPPGSPSPPAS